MNTWAFRTVLLTVVVVLAEFNAECATLQVGAAKVDITPSADAALPMSGYADRTGGFEGIHAHIHTRASVVSDGTKLATIIAWELIGVPNAAWDVLSQRIAQEI